ncbi:MAG: hypothetical protein R3250_15825 [Melioribacteraceae bacterium]|nr:hypothetical protein [Melioribacteraceae bacterium]
MDEEQKGKAYPIAAFIMALIGIPLILMPYFGIVCSILAMVLAAKNKEHGLSIAGKIIGIIGIVLNSVMLLIFLLAIGIMLIL